MVISQGDVCRASLGPPRGSEPALRRPVLVVQGDDFNASRIATTVVVALTSNLRLEAAPGNVLLEAARTGLPRDSVANVSQVLTIDKTVLEERAGQITGSDLALVLAGIELVLGRQ